MSDNRRITRLGPPFALSEGRVASLLVYQDLFCCNGDCSPIGLQRSSGFIITQSAAGSCGIFMERTSFVTFICVCVTEAAKELRYPAMKPE